MGKAASPGNAVFHAGKGSGSVGARRPDPLTKRGVLSMIDIGRALPLDGQLLLLTNRVLPMLTSWVPAERSTRVWGHVRHQRQNDDEAHEEAQSFRPASSSHPRRPLSQEGGVDRHIRQRSAPPWGGADPIIPYAPLFVDPCPRRPGGGFFRAGWSGRLPSVPQNRRKAL